MDLRTTINNSLNFLNSLLRNHEPGGGWDLLTTSDVDHFPGCPEGISCPDIVDKFRAQTLRFRTTIISESIPKVDLSSRPFKFGRDRRDPFQVALGALVAPSVVEHEYELG